jgi:predicted metalloendopeptidase
MVIRQSNTFYVLATIWRSKARDAAIKNQVKQIHTLQECTVRMCLCKNDVDTHAMFYVVQN